MKFVILGTVVTIIVIALYMFHRKPKEQFADETVPDEDDFVPDNRQELFGSNKPVETTRDEQEITVRPLQGVLPNSSRVFESAGDTNFTTELAPDSIAEMQRARRTQHPPVQSARSRFISTNTKVVTPQ